MAWSDVGAVDSGSFLGVTTDDSESCASFRGLAQAFSHHTNSTSCASFPVDSQVTGPSGDTEVHPKFQHTSSRQGFGLGIGTTKGRLGRET